MTTTMRPLAPTSEAWSSQRGQGDGDDRVVVVGAGITGLTAAWAARRAGRQVMLLESEPRVGGVIATERCNDYLVELGPTSMVETPEAAGLIDELGLATSRVRPGRDARRRYVVRRGRLCALPSSPLSLATTSALSWRGKARLLCEPLLRTRDAHAREESVAELVRRRFGEDVLRYVVDPFVSGVYAGDPQRLSAEHALRRLADLERRHGSVLLGGVHALRDARRHAPEGGIRPTSGMTSFDGGLERLTSTLGAACGASVQCGSRLISVRRRHGRWLVTWERQRRIEQRCASSVVLAIPAHAYDGIEMDREILEALAPVRRVTYAPVATVALGFHREDVLHPLDGFGVLAPSAESSNILGALFTSTMFAGRAPRGMVLVTCFVGGARLGEHALANPSAMVPSVVASLRALLGVRGAPTMVHCTRWERAIPQFEVGYSSVHAAASDVEAIAPGLLLAGAWRAGVSIADCIANGLAAGRRAAKIVGLSALA